jgi:tetratricopeptide (TPR) repeat protein
MPFDRNDWLILAAIVALTAATFANGLLGDFVHDDKRQIQRNDLIRSPQLWGQALTHDVWAFLGERNDRPWSNYWRPGHVAWLILNVQLFGASNPLPWHVTNLLAHLAAVVATYLVLRRLGASRGVGGAIVLLFAIHPTRAESVTWIAGVHDVLCTLWQMLALLCLFSAWRTEHVGRPAGDARQRRFVRAGLAVLFYILAITTKEIAICFPLIVWLVRWTDPVVVAMPAPQRRRRALQAATPFAVVALAFLVARYIVLGRAQIAYGFRPSWPSVLATLPSVVVFYLRQMVFPYQLGWTYPLRTIGAAQGASAGWWNFWLPLLICTLIIALLARVRWDRLRLIGVAILLFTLLPAMNIRAFLPDQIVKDRFLYLPLLGFLMIIVPTVAAALRKLGGGDRAARRLGFALTACVAIALAGRTIAYNRAWRSEVALWENAVRTDPTSALNHQSLAVALIDAKQYARARPELTRAIEIAPVALSYLALADLDLAEQRYADATADAEEAIRLAPDDYRGYERLAVSYEKRGLFADAEAALRRGIEQAPYRRVSFTDQLAVMLYQQGKRDDALRELESVRGVAATEFASSARLVYFHLGMLYAELGREPEARQALQQFLDLTATSSDPALAGSRKAAKSALSRLSPI